MTAKQSIGLKFIVLLVALLHTTCAQDNIDELIESTFLNSTNEPLSEIEELEQILQEVFSATTPPVTNTPIITGQDIPAPAIETPSKTGAENSKPSFSLDPEGTTNGTCECVPYYLCTLNGTFVTDGSDVIDIREDRECANYMEVCCGGDKKIVERTTPPPLAHSRGCGYRNAEGVGFRISGHEANEAEFGEFPWMVPILYEQEVGNGSLKKMINVYQCGGALIHPQAVLTAAHCVTGAQDGKKFHILAGEWDTQTDEEIIPHQTRAVESIVKHAKYYKGGLHNDIAILFLESPVNYAENVDVVCLPPQSYTIDRSLCYVTGWGKHRYGQEGVYQAILKKIDVPYVKRPECQEALRKTRLGKRFILHESFVCAGGEAGKDACLKDGGSPMVCPILDKAGRYMQTGIVAWGIGCGVEGTPGVYVNVALFRNWIDEQMSKKGLDITTYAV